MSKPSYFLFIGFIALIGTQALVGCSESAPDKPVKLASQADVMQANVSKAKTVLDQLQKIPKKDRQASANKPRMASVLKAAASDSDTKKRMDDLGITIE